MRPPLAEMDILSRLSLATVTLITNCLLRLCHAAPDTQIDLTRLRLPQLDFQKLPIKADPNFVRGLEAMIGRFEAVVDGALHAVDQYDRQLYSGGEGPAGSSGPIAATFGPGNFRSNLGPAGGGDKTLQGANDIYSQLASKAAAAGAGYATVEPAPPYGIGGGNTIGRSIYHTRPVTSTVPTVQPTLYAPASLFDVEEGTAPLEDAKPIRIITVDGVDIPNSAVPVAPPPQPTAAPLPPPRIEPRTKRPRTGPSAVANVASGAGLLEIDFANGAKVRTAGAPLPAKQTYYAPVKLDWPEASSYYLHTLVMFSVGMHGGGEEFVHWLVVNMPGTRLGECTTVVEYLPALPADTDSARKPYILLVYRQSRRLQSVRIDGQAFVTDEQIRGRESPSWSLDAFVDAHHLGDPIAGNFYTITKTQSVESGKQLQ